METKSTKTTERVTGADAVVRILLQEGVDLVFGYPGGAIMPYMILCTIIRIKFITY